MVLESLEARGVRDSMHAELELDVQRNDLYLSPRLSKRGQAEYQQLLREALTNGTPEALAAALARPGLLNDTEVRQTKKGPVTARVPVTAAETLSEGEFNRFYARGVCRQALATGQDTVEVYRAKAVDAPRTESTAKIGTVVSAERLLEDLRAHVGMDTALGVPAGPNSGLSVRLRAAG